MLNIKRKGRICKTDFLFVIQTGMPLSSKVFFKSPSKKLMTITEYPNSLNMQARFKRALGAPVFVNSWENKRIFLFNKNVYNIRNKEQQRNIHRITLQFLLIIKKVHLISN